MELQNENSDKKIILFPNNFNNSKGGDLISFINKHKEFNEFILSEGEYNTGDINGHNLSRDNIIIKAQKVGKVFITKHPNREVSAFVLAGENILIHGLTWNGIKNGLRTNPGTVSIAGKNNKLSYCYFTNFNSSVKESIIITIGRKNHKELVDASNTIIENCIFDGWGYFSNTVNKTASGCINIGTEGVLTPSFSGVIIRNNKFINGPYKQYGYNSAIKISQTVSDTLIENNHFDKLQEVMEVKTSNLCVRKNKITNASGYNILANRAGNNNLYEDNYVENIFPIDDGKSKSQAMMIWKGSNVVYRNNTFCKCKDMGYFIGKEKPNDPDAGYWLITDNTFTEWKHNLFSYKQPSSVNAKKGYPKNIYLYNNTFHSTDENIPKEIVKSSGDTDFNKNSVKVQLNNHFKTEKLEVNDDNFGVFSKQTSSTNPDIDEEKNIIFYPIDNNLFSIGLLENKSKILELQVFNELEIMVFHQFFEKSEVNIFEQVMIPNPGNYKVQIKTENKIFTKKLIKDNILKDYT